MKKIICVVYLITIASLVFSQEWSDCCWKKNKSGLEYKVEKKGMGKKLKKGDTVKIHWIWFNSQSGERLMSSYDNGIEGQEWVVGSGTFVKGFEEGFYKIKRGGEAYLKIPPDIAYGESGLQGQKTFCYFIKIIYDYK
jgi:FKBP-type peptidyl-prolyl cis-trans isomerase